MRTRPVFVVLAVLAIVAAYYCLSAYAMYASFSVAHENEAYARLAVGFEIAGLVSLALCLLFAFRAWRAR